MTITDSARGPKTKLDVFPDIPASFTHPGNTQKHVFDIPDHVPYYDLVRDWWPEKITCFCSLKKNVAISMHTTQNPPGEETGAHKTRLS